MVLKSNGAASLYADITIEFNTGSSYASFAMTYTSLWYMASEPTWEAVKFGGEDASRPPYKFLHFSSAEVRTNVVCPCCAGGLATAMSWLRHWQCLGILLQLNSRYFDHLAMTTSCYVSFICKCILLPYL